jgi:hypothetical protein
VPPVQGGDLEVAEPLGECDHACIYGTEWQIVVRANEIRHPPQVLRKRVDQLEHAVDDGGQESASASGPSSRSIK